MTSLSDLYSLGALAYRLLAGPPEPRRVATGDRVGACPRLRRLADVRPGLPVGVADAVDRALEHDPDARQSSVAEFRAQLLARRTRARTPRDGRQRDHAIRLAQAAAVITRAGRGASRIT